MSAPSPSTIRIGRVSLTVPELAAAVAFYQDAFGFQPVAPDRRCAAAEADLLGTPGATITAALLRLHGQEIELLTFDPPGAAYPPDSTASDLWFQHCALVVSDMPAAYAHLQRFAPQPISKAGPQLLPPNTGSVSAYKFRDPFGHPLELLHFPDGTGDPVWHERGPKPLFLGIDHTAIAVGDAARSIRFYADQFGLANTAKSLNAGPEQSRLDAVPRDRVGVSAMTPVRALPHLELLSYETGLRRPRPADWNAAAIAETRTVLDVHDVANIRARLEQAGLFWRHGSWEDRDALYGRDPDGHAIMVRASR